MPSPPGTDRPRSVSIAFVRSAVRALDAAARATVLDEAGIAPALLAQPGARVPAQAFARLWMAVALALDDEFFGLDARRMKVGSFAMLCHAVAGQPTVGAALRQALRGFGLFFDDLTVSLRVAGGQALLQIDNRIRTHVHTHFHATAGDAADARRFADETLLVMLHGLLCWLAGRRVPLARVDWAHPPPAHADEYRRMFGPLQRFDATATVAVFDARVLAAAATVTPASLKAFLRDAPQSVFLKQVVPTGLGDRARRLCRSALDQGQAAPTLAELGRALGLSTATLRRRLDAEGAAWGPLKDEVRRDLALQLLAERRLSVADIATRLGFEDASTFYRAFRKWTGSAPGAWRSAQQATLPAG
ncbi:AraC family transcriptional regulator [Pseudaquabacterium pictum]|uniref:AraC family transcriptional regulator n=1 Tax=Pseudaquabacterium pictum TaxID=2315236 RepID=A0A480AS06_9BURK|nr:AraC family transcriptional regulator [Rubrivivax pictus]GCL63726.1 AraC family transcriptional regulator [Rubrivivax pictus]